MVPKTEFHVTLTDDEIAYFHENGFVAIPRITTDEEIEWLRDIYDELFTKRVGEAEGQYFDLGGKRAHDGTERLPQVLGPERAYPELRETNVYRNSRRIASQLLELPEDGLNHYGHMILKPAGYGRETAWHQDEAYWNPAIAAKFVSAWMPLDAVTVEGGCMQFIPGSHKPDEIFPHHHVDHDPTVHALETDFVDPAKAAACPLPAGGATFHHWRTLHYAARNTTNTARRAYINVFSGPHLKRESPPSRPWQDEEREALAKMESLARRNVGD